MVADRQATSRTTRRSSAGFLTEDRLVVGGLVAATQMSFGGIVPALPSYGAELGIGAVQLGAVVSAFGVGRLLINVPAGVVLRWVSPLVLMVVSVLGVLVSTVGVACVGSYTPVLVLRAAAGVFAGAAITAGQSMLLTGAASSERGRVMTVLQAFQMTGAALGPAVGGIAAAVAGPRAAFLACAAGMVVFLAWAVVRWESLHGRLSRRAPMPGGGGAADRRKGARDWRTAAAVVVINLIGFAVFAVRFGGQQSLVPLVGTERLGLTSWQTGAGMAGVTVLSLALLPVVARVVDTRDRRWVLVPTLLVSAGMTPLFLVVGSQWAYLAVLAVTGAMSSLGNGVPLAQLADALPSDKVPLATGLYRTCGDLGTIAGPLALAHVLEAHGPGPAVLSLAGLSTVAAAAALVPVARRAAVTAPAGSAAARGSAGPTGSDGSASERAQERDLIGAVVAGRRLDGAAVGQQQTS